MKTCVKIIIPLIILCSIIFLLIGKKNNEKYTTQSEIQGPPSYYVYKKIEQPFSDQTRGYPTKSLPDTKDEKNRIDKESFSSCNEFCN